MNDGCVLLDFDEVSTDGLFKVLLFEDSNSEHGFRVIIVKTSYIKTLKDEVFRKGFINTSKFTKVYTGTLPKEAFEQYLDVKGIFNKANKTEIYSTVCLDGKVLISFDEARKVAKKRAARYKKLINWRDDYHFDIPKSKRGSIFGKNDITAVRYKRMSFPDIKIKYSPFYYVIDENSNRRRVDLSPFDKK